MCASVGLSTRPSLPGTVGTPAFFATSRAATLSPIRRMTSPGGPTKVESRSFDGVGEIGLLGKEAVARWTPSAPALRGGQDGFDVQIGFGGWCRPMLPLVGELTATSQSASLGPATVLSPVPWRRG